MKKRVVDLLSYAIRKENGKNILYYKVCKNKMIFSRKKELSVKCMNFMIEDKWQDARIPLTFTAAIVKHVGIYSIVKHKEEIEDAKEWVFGSILYGILVQELEPKDTVVIWVENTEEGIKVCGICEVL